MAAARFIPAPDQGDSQVVVLAAELYPEVVVLVLVTTISDELVAAGLYQRDNPAGLTIEDDVGTKYRRAFQLGFAGEWSLSHDVQRANLHFKPPVPPEATYLRVKLGRWGHVVLMV